MADRAFELRRLGGSQEPGREHDRVLPPRPAENAQGMSVADHVQTGRGRWALAAIRSAEAKSWTPRSRRSRDRTIPRIAVRVPVERDAREQPCEEHDREEAIAADEPAEAGEKRGRRSPRRSSSD